MICISLFKFHSLRFFLSIFLLECSYIFGQALSYNQLATLSSNDLINKGKEFFSDSTKPDSALMCFSIVASRYHEGMSPCDIEQIVYALNRKWHIYFYNYYNYEKATEALSKALALCEQYHLSKSTVLLNFGNMNHLIAEQTGDTSILKTTADYYSQALAESKKENIYTVYITALNNLIEIRYRQDDLDQLKDLAPEVDSLDISLGMIYSIYAYHFYYGVISLKNAEFDSALQHFSLIADLFEPCGNNTYYRYMAFEGQALALSQSNRFAQAIDLLLAMEEECIRLDKKDVLLFLYTTLHDIYLENGMKEKADDYYQKYLVARDRLINYRQMVSFSEVKFLEQLRQDEQRMAQMIYRQRMMTFSIWAIGIFAVIISLLLLWVHYKSRILARANRDLYIKNVELLEKEEKERNHRLGYKYNSYKLDDEQQQALADNIQRVIESCTEIFESDFSVTRLAEIVGTPVKDVSKTINICFNCNFNNLINKYRVQEACRRISRHDEYASYTIEAIGNSVGFKSRSTFIAAFKSFTGLKPSEYQRMSRNSNLGV